jgi:DNA mismatch repair protein MutL
MTPLLEKTGFEIDAFGRDSFVIRAVPSTFEGESAAAVLKTFLEQKEDGKVHTDLEHQKEEIAALIACKKKSVRAFEPLTLVQIQSLLQRLALCKNPFSCPHGRPSIIQYSFLDLEKQFKRK